MCKQARPVCGNVGRHNHWREQARDSYRIEVKQSSESDRFEHELRYFGYKFNAISCFKVLFILSRNTQYEIRTQGRSQRGGGQGAAAPPPPRGTLPPPTFKN